MCSLFKQIYKLFNFHLSNMVFSSILYRIKKYGRSLFITCGSNYLKNIILGLLSNWPVFSSLQNNITKLMSSKCMCSRLQFSVIISATISRKSDARFVFTPNYLSEIYICLLFSNKGCNSQLCLSVYHGCGSWHFASQTQIC